MTCVFCHNEGTPVTGAHDKETLLPLPGYSGGRVSVFEETNGVDFLAGRMEPDESFVQVLETMRDLTNTQELHLTGGEPTLHPRLPDVIRQATSLGFEVKMTSNGENGRRHIKECAEAGLQKINFSIFGLTPEELSQVQHEKYANHKIAQVKINALHSSIEEALANGIKVDANIVMSRFEHAERVARIIDKYGSSVSVRILNDLDVGDESMVGIYRFLAKLNAEPVEQVVEAGTSNSRIKYQLPDGTEVHFKQIRRTVLPDTCGDCSLNNTDKCSEGYYGLRLYVDTDNQYKVGVCLKRMDLTENIEDFAVSSLPKEIVDFRETEYNQLINYYQDRLSDGEV